MIVRCRWTLLVSLFGCAQFDATFHCTSDAACARMGAPGTCEAVGFCSRVDTSCPSGRRFDDSAGAPFGSQCVGAATDAGADAGADAQADATIDAVDAGCGGLGQPCCGATSCDPALQCLAGTCSYPPLAPMPTARHGLGLALVGKDLFAIGGGPQRGNSYTTVVEVFTP